MDDRTLDLVLDHLNTLNDLTPKVRCNGCDGVDPNLLFGIDSKLFKGEPDGLILENHHDEVETQTVFKGLASALPHTHLDGHKHEESMHRSDSSASLHQVTHGSQPSSEVVDEGLLRSSLEQVPKESVWRVKGFVRLQEGLHILNWAFGRYDLIKADMEDMNDTSIRLTVMGERGEVKRAMYKFCSELHAVIL